MKTMKNNKTYTQSEINSNINTLTVRLDSLILERKAIASAITSIKKQIKGWEEIDENQYKIF
jgi:hypothetical protein